jgi:hypothetical protein
MQTKPLLKKGLVVGIIVLLLGMSSVPIQGTLIEQRSTMKHTMSWEINWTINGTMGPNGWYVSPLNFSCIYDHYHIASVYYKVHIGDEWTLYTEPFTVYEGSIEFCWYFVDYQGNVEAPEGPFDFKIDYTPPSITFSVTSENPLKTKWLLNATVADETSGVAYVDFYVDDMLIGNTTAPSPYIYIYTGEGKTAYAIAYDNAGNYAISSIVNSYAQNQGNSIIHQLIILLRSVIHNLLFHHQMKGWNQ